MFGNGDKIVIGYDLSDEYVQISYCRMDEDMPSTLSLTEGAEQYNIPACLFKRLEVNQWFYGMAAVNYEKVEEGTMITGLFEKAMNGDEVPVLEEYFDPIALLALFVKRSLSLLSPAIKTDKIAGIMFTVPILNPHVIEVLGKMTVLLDMPQCHMAFQGREESIYHYVIHQPAPIWQYDVLIYDFSHEALESYYLERNEKTTPQVVFIRKTVHEEVTKSTMDDNDVQFLHIVQEETEGKLVSCGYLVGDGFATDWCMQSIKELCRNRRAFKGNNLYSKGACYAMGEKKGKEPEMTNIIFLGKDKLKANVGMKVRKGQKNVYLPLMNGGDNWYDCEKEYDFILQSGNSFGLIITPLDGRNVKNVEVIMDGLTPREERTTRLRIRIRMNEEEEIELKITDMGFGEIFPQAGQIFEQKIQL